MDDFEVRDHRAKRKKDYGDMKRRVTSRNVIPGEKVLVDQHKENKLHTSFNLEPMTVKAKHGTFK